MSLSIVGCTTLDVIVTNVARLPVWPRHTEFTSDNLVLLPEPPILTVGGNGANAAFVAARCGATTTLHTTLGEEAHGRLARQWLEDAGCQVHSPRRVSTPVNVTASSSKHQRATFFYPGAPLRFPKREAFLNTSHLLVCGWPHPPMSVLTRSLPSLRRDSVFVGLDAGPIIGPAWSPEVLGQILKNLDLFIANEHEVKTLTQSSSLQAAIRVIRQAYPRHIVIKRGGKGAVWVAEGTSKPESVEAPKIKAINTIGAGDSFNGGLMAALSQGETFPSALRSACQVAASVVASGHGVLGAKNSR